MRRQEGGTQREGHGTAEAGTGAVQPLAEALADGKEGFSSQLSEGAGPAHGVISDVQPPGC